MAPPLRPPLPPRADYNPDFRLSPSGSVYEVISNPLIPKRTTSLKPRPYQRNEQVPSGVAVTPEVEPTKIARNLVPARPRVPKAPVLRVKPHNQVEVPPPRPLTRAPFLPSLEEKQRELEILEENQIYQNEPNIYENEGFQSTQNETRMPTYPRPSETQVYPEEAPDNGFDSDSSYLDSTFDETEENLYEDIKDPSFIMQEGTNYSAGSVDPNSMKRGVFKLQIDPSVGSASAKHSDPYIGSDRVYTLNENNIDTIAFSDDPAMVFFYDPRDNATHATRDQFRKAAESKTTYTHNFGAVNCLQDPEFCKKWEIEKPPVIKVFSEGSVVGTVRELSTFDSKAMTKFMDTLVSIKHSTASKSNDNSRSSRMSKCSFAKLFGFKK